MSSTETDQPDPAPERPMALGFKSDEIRRVISVGGDDEAPTPKPEPDKSNPIMVD